MSEPTTAEVISAAIESRLLDLHTSMPAKVVVYNPLTQTVDAQPMIRRAIEKKDGSIAHEAIPVVMNVPVMWLRGGGFSMRFPLDTGDTVWLQFSEAATAQWRSTGQLSNPGDLRRFDLSYACAIPAGYPSTQPITTPVPPGTAHVETPGDFVFGNPITAQYVALADLVATMVSTAIAGHTHTGVTTGAGVTGNGVLAGSLLPVAASSLKASP
jgi:hypothetical protein